MSAIEVRASSKTKQGNTMNIQARICFEVSRRLMRPPAERTVDYGAYNDWRRASLSGSWNGFSDSQVTGKDVLDFGCGDGQLSLFLAKEKHPRRILGIDISSAAIERAKASLANTNIADGVQIDYTLGSTRALPVPDQSFDTLLAFDCLEHVMFPGAILRDWYRVLRPGGRCLIEWFPYKGPWGPHMEALVPIPWAHVIFGEKAMFRTAEAIYDLPDFVPRHWDLDEQGNKKPNKWRGWSSFEEQNYINKLDIPTFRRLAKDAGFEIDRLELRSFGGSLIRQYVARTLMSMPVIGEYFVSSSIIELLRPKGYVQKDSGYT
jgi:2-polyprenyl-3-methyl-5-hydroxy-6-metoxy-1,4-benzoquinol methylase